MPEKFFYRAFPFHNWYRREYLPILTISSLSSDGDSQFWRVTLDKLTSNDLFENCAPYKYARNVLTSSRTAVIRSFLPKGSSLPKVSYDAGRPGNGVMEQLSTASVRWVFQPKRVGGVLLLVPPLITSEHQEFAVVTSLLKEQVLNTVKRKRTTEQAVYTEQRFLYRRWIYWNKLLRHKQNPLILTASFSPRRGGGWGWGWEEIGGWRNLREVGGMERRLLG